MAKQKDQYTEEDEQALRNLESAATAMRRGLGGKAGESAEKNYLQAYKRCFQLGLKDYPPVVGATTR
jgi:uncharacterized protein YukE